MRESMVAIFSLAALIAGGSCISAHLRMRREIDDSYQGTRAQQLDLEREHNPSDAYLSVAGRQFKRHSTIAGVISLAFGALAILAANWQ